MAENVASLEQVYFLTKTFATLQLYEREAIADTLLSMLCTFMDVETGAVLLFSDAERTLAVAAKRRPAESDFDLGPHAIDALAVLAREGSTRVIARDEATLWKASWRSPVAVACLRAADTPLGIIAVGLSTETSASASSIGLLTAAAGIGSLAITNANAVREARALGASLEKTALEAQRDAIEKSRLYAELDAKLWTIREQEREIGTLAFPILSLSTGVVVAPVIGRVDVHRGAALADRLLAGISSSQAQVAILDVTGAIVVGTSTAEQIVRVVRAVRLLGVEVVVSGVQPSVAVALGEQGLRDLGDAKTFSTLAGALTYANARMAATQRRRAVVRK
jgi:anti-anti-sigma regulatory factor